MIIIRVMGGLGNQMQQYALYEKFKFLGKDVRLDVSWFEDEDQQRQALAPRKLELRMFDQLPFQCCTEQEKKTLIGDDSLVSKVMRKLRPGRKFVESDMYHPEIFDKENCYLEGYWACEKYYQNILNILQNNIRFPKSQNSQNVELKRKMMAENSVSIHIRRGDYLDPANAAMFGGICTEEYYETAEKYVRDNVKNPHFYLFSDDSEYLREHYSGEEYTIVDWNTGDESFYDMELMSCCRHNICANSTFSFWGARLNRNKDKIMIRPAKHKNSQVIKPEVMHDLWQEWVLIDGEGKKI